jgi:signal transduction histidine kinase
VIENAHDVELRHLLAEQSALRRVATLVAGGADEEQLATAVAAEIVQIFGAESANALRWDGDTLRVIGEWSRDDDHVRRIGSVWVFGGDTITARVIATGRPARVESAADLTTPFGQARWRELGLQASIGAPIVLDGRVWGVLTASRTTENDPFPPGAETRLADFAGLVATAIANSETQREVTALAEEQAALRRVATLVAAGKPQAEVLEAVAREAAHVYGADTVNLVRWTGVPDEVAVVTNWAAADAERTAAGSVYHPAPGSATLRVLETGKPARTEEASPQFGPRCVIAAPVIVNAELLGAINALRPPSRPFAPGAEVRLRSFGDLAAQAVANERAREALQASRARIVRAADDERRKLERNLHDGAQQRLVAVLISLRLALAKLPPAAGDSRALLAAAIDELMQAIDDLRELARGIHPAVLTERGLGPALELLARRAPLPVDVATELDERLPAPVEAAAYYVVAESLTNVAKHAAASAVEVRVSRDDGLARVEVVDDGVGGAELSRGSGLRGLADRVEALDGRLGVESAPAAGTRIWAEIPLDGTRTP